MPLHLPRPLALVVFTAVLFFSFGQSTLAQPDQSTLFAQKQKLWSEGTWPTVATLHATDEQYIPNFPLGTVRTYWGVVYQSFRDGNFEIYLQSVALGDTRLTDNPASDTQPRLNPDASQIVFVSDRDGNGELYIMNRDGTEQTRLTFNDALDSNPSWSPDGNEILFVSARDGNNELYLMNKDGSNLRRLTNNTVADFQPSLSPDGQHIAWIQATSQSTGSLWVMNRDGSDPHPILTDKSFIQHPVWSPDSSQIAFDYDATGDLFNEVAIIQAGGTGLRVVTFGLYDPHYQLDRWMGSWAPDSKFFFYTHIQWAVNRQQQYYIDYATIAASCEMQTLCSPVYASGVTDFLPDARPLDGFAPVTQIAPLPPFVRRATGSIAWRGNDIGVAGIKNFDLQYRSDQNPEWQNWLAEIPPLDATLQEASALGSGGFEFVSALPASGKVYLRARATDQAKNVEAWPESLDGDATSVFYAYKLSGRVTDARGIPFSNAKVPLTPDALIAPHSDLSGHYATYLADGGSYSLDNSVALDIGEDTVRDYYVAPSQNLIVNGDFENQYANWLGEGELPPSLSADAPFRNAQSMLLGVQCGGACVTRLQTPSSLNREVVGVLPIAGRDGSLHLLVNTPSGLIYQLRQPDGTWRIHTFLVNGVSMSGMDATLDSENNLHVLWATAAGGIYYSVRRADGSVSAQAHVGDGVQPVIARDASGNLHFAYVCQVYPECQPNQIRYRTLRRDGQWSDTTPVASEDTISALQMQLTRDGVVHLAWIEGDYDYRSFNGRLLHRVRYTSFISPSATGSIQTLDMGYHDDNWDANHFAGVRMLLDSEQSLHLFWLIPTQNAIVHLQKPLASNWQAPELKGAAPNGANLGTFFVAIDQQDTLHLLGIRYNQQPPLYWRKLREQEWSDPKVLNGLLVEPSNLSVYQFVALPAGQLLVEQHSEAPTARLSLINVSSDVGLSSISQQVTIPTTLHRPTLAFMFQLNDGDAANTLLDVTVTAELTHSATISDSVVTTKTFETTQIFSATHSSNWTLGWADMQKWQGKPITITFRAEKRDGGTVFAVALDDISLGPWHTPIITQVIPSHVAYGVGQELLIHGDNFMSTPSVRLGERTLSGVVWVNEQRLRLVIPADLDPGIYDLWVANPAGANSVAPGGFSVGRQVYLPLMARQ